MSKTPICTLSWPAPGENVEPAGTCARDKHPYSAGCVVRAFVIWKRSDSVSDLGGSSALVKRENGVRMRASGHRLFSGWICTTY